MLRISRFCGKGLKRAVAKFAYSCRICADTAGKIAVLFADNLINTRRLPRHGLARVNLCYLNLKDIWVS